MNRPLTVALPPSGVPRRCAEWVARLLRTSSELEVRTAFTRDHNNALLRGDADAVMCDAGTAMSEEHSEIVAAAVLHRLQVRDHVLARRGALHPSHANPFGLADGARLAVSSPRQAGAALAWCDVAITLVEPLTDIVNEPYDACVLSGLELEDFICNRELVDDVALRPEVLLPAPGHAAYALVARTDTPHLALLSSLHDRTTERCVTAELELLELMGSHDDGLGCLAHEMEDGAIRLMASISRVDEDHRSATVTKVGAVAPDPVEVARACFATFEEIGPGA